VSKTDKLLESFISTPFPEWKDLVALLGKFGYVKLEGKGSRVRFVNLDKQSVFELHRPHPSNTIKTYVKNEIIRELTAQGFIKK
jgi:predicted RNA binding protein YcfA (HicA-like mRNA interferase family)